MQTFGDRVRQARTHRNIGQTDLAQRAGIHRVHLARIESGHQGKRPRPATIAALADALDVSPGWLATGTGLPRSATR